MGDITPWTAIVGHETLSKMVERFGPSNCVYALQKIHSLTQQQFAGAMGIRQSELSRVLRGSWRGERVPAKLVNVVREATGVEIESRRHKNDLTKE